MTAPLDPVEQKLFAVDLRLDELEDRVKSLLDANANPTLPKPTWQHQTVDAWVEGWFVEAYVRSPVVGMRWCAQWREHSEAVIRLTAMWRSWESCQRDVDRGLSTWFASYGDPQFYELTSPSGTFRSCGVDSHRVLPPLPA